MRLAGLIAAALAALPAAPAGAQEVRMDLGPGEVLLKVEADGRHMSRPDVMGISASVVTTGKSAKEALAANSELAGRMLQAVRSSGVEPRDIQTSELTVAPQFAREGGSDDEDDDSIRRITGYVARNEVSLQLRDLNKAGSIVNALFEAGANEVSGPTFSLSDSTGALREARRDAVAEARVEADTYAEALGMKVGRVLRVSERGSVDNEDSSVITVTGSRVPTPRLEPGEVRTGVTVWIDYAMVPR